MGCNLNNTNKAINEKDTDYTRIIQFSFSVIRKQDLNQTNRNKWDNDVK